MAKSKSEWVIFGQAFWDPKTLVARAEDGLFIYPNRYFNPKAGKYYYLTPKERVSKKTQQPYYVGEPRHVGHSRPPKLLEFIQRLEAFKEENSKLQYETYRTIIEEAQGVQLNLF